MTAMPRRKSRSSPGQPPLSEENLAYEINEDNKLRSIGIDPDAPLLEIMIELEKRRIIMEEEMAREEEKELEEERAKGKPSGSL